jgi:ribosome maturation factor RimP
MTSTTELEKTIETRISDLDPEVELVALEQPAGETLRIYIDRPGGVDLALCERVTNQLRDLLARWSLEVSSPGMDRPLTKPEHFSRYLGHEARVRTREPIEGQRNFTGRLAAADESSVSLETHAGLVTIPLAGIRRSNLIPEFEEVPK